MVIWEVAIVSEALTLFKELFRVSIFYALHGPLHFTVSLLAASSASASAFLLYQGFPHPQATSRHHCQTS